MTGKAKKNPKVKQPNFRDRAFAEMCAIHPHYSIKSNVFGSLFLVGLGLIFWEIYIYRITFISVYIPIFIWLIPGIIITPFLKKIFNIYCFNPYTPGNTHMFFHYLFNIVSFGGSLMFLFMWTNQTFTDKSKNVLTVPIESYGYLAKSKNGCGEPYADIRYKDHNKELIFPCGTAIEKYHRVYIEVTKGLFGFEVITNQTLIEGQW
ncbi:MAG TPA: hypothetical protein VGG71_14505 [Chitinophagaceae bacterium]|jgi:hypothetical protein